MRMNGSLFFHSFCLHVCKVILMVYVEALLLAQVTPLYIK